MVRALLTAEQLYDLPDEDLHYELVQGRLVSEPPPGGDHGRVAATITGLLTQYAWRHRTGVVLTCDTYFVLARGPDTVRGPDVAFMSRERFLALDEPERAIPGAPDLAVEVLSPGNREAETIAKVADYLAAGAALVWVVDPRLRRVRCYRRLPEPETLSESDSLTADDLLPGFRVAVRDIFEV